MSNMQNDASAFEGWALGLKRWLSEIAHVELSWRLDGPLDGPHYQRFLFRVQQFAAIFPSWFSVAASHDTERLRLKTTGPGPFFVTAPKQERFTPENHKCGSIAQSIKSEHQLECFIKDNPRDLSDLLGITDLDRQYPVGIFDRAVRSGNEIFPSRHSAIDLWGVSEQNLVLFELKAAGNKPMGILSELFFYSHVIEGVQRKWFALEKEDTRIQNTDAVCAYILAPEWHPLIDEKLLRLANSGFRDSQRRIRFGIVRIAPDSPQPFILEMRACD